MRTIAPTTSSASVVLASPSLSKNYVTLAVLSVVAAVLVTAWTSPDWTINREEGVSIKSSTGNASASLTDKYESNMVKISPHPLLVGALSDVKCPDFQPSEEGLTHVELVLGKEQLLRDRNQVFFMLNGENEGFYMPWTHQFTDQACVFKLAQMAALHLGSDLDLLVNGIKLYSVDGLPILTVDELDTQRIAHVLLDGQLWVWPGVKVGYKREIEGCTVTTQSLRPKVFTVEGFFTQEEADTIIAEGVGHLSRSPVDSPDAKDGYHADRTSFTAFLDDSHFTRDFRVRSSRLARLPSPGYTENLQLVRYETGQFFRKHEDYFDSKVFVPTENSAADQFEEWVTWASSTINQLRQDHGDTIVPVEFLPGGVMFPDIQSTVTFHHALLQAFMEDAEASNFFWEHADLEWKSWIAENLDLRADNIMGPILESKGYMLPFIVDSWAKRAGHSELVYSCPKAPISGVSHFFRWIQWAKERVQILMDKQPEAVPKRVRPEGEDYPTFYMSFQNRMASHILEDYTRDFLVETLTEDFYAWLVDNKDNEDVLLEILRSVPSAFDLVVDSWTKRAGNVFTYVKPKHLRHFEPNRFATLFLYLNDCPEGGETVFPYSKERLVTGIEREGMKECSDGLAVPPVKLTASLFYSQTPMNDLDPSSLHGGCPPANGVKFGANSFMWNADADEGANAWGMGEDIKSMSALSQQ